MKQEIFNFDFKFKSKEFFLSSKNFLAYKLIKEWPKWTHNFVYIYGPSNCGKTSFCEMWKENSNALFIDKKRLEMMINSNFQQFSLNSKNWIIDDIESLISIRGKNYDEKILNLLNFLQANKSSFLLITSSLPPRFLSSKLMDLISRLSSMLIIEIKQPDEELLVRIIKKYLKDRNIILKNENIDFIIKRIDRTYSAARKISKLIDTVSLENQQNISKTFLSNLIKKLY